MKTLIAAAALIASTVPALACQSLESVLAEYRAEYGERPYWMGNSFSDENRGKTILILTSPHGSWTLFTVTPRGACIKDHGFDAEPFRQGDL